MQYNFLVNKSSMKNIVFILFSVYFLFLIFPDIRYSTYFAIIVSLLFGSLRFGQIYNLTLSKPFVLLMFCALGSFVVKHNYESIKEIILIFTFIIPFLSFQWDNSDVERLFKIMLISFVFTVALLIVSSSHKFSFSIVDSESFIENPNICYSFMFFYFYFSSKRKKVFSIICLVVFFITLKRIGLAALFSGFILMQFPLLISKKTYKWTYIVILNVLAFGFVYFVVSDYFNELSLEYFGVSSNHFTMGRVSIFDSALYACNDVSCSIFGEGVATLYSHLANDVGYLFTESSGRIYMHNEVARLVIELGVPLAVLFFYYMYNPVIKYFNSFVIVIAYNVTMIADNSLIYSVSSFVYLVVLQSVFNDEKLNN
jgi:hypothetical protein